MKIGIVTINGNENYGNVLQNYAVQEVLKKVGAEAETIPNLTRYGHWEKAEKVNKFTPSYIKKYVTSQLNYRYNIKNTNRGLIRVIRFYKQHKDEIEALKEIRTKKFIEFKEEYIVHSQHVLDINKTWTREQIDEYDFFVSGSDQVWNPVYPSTSSINFLQFAPEEKRISLSPSFGINKIPEELHNDYAKWLYEIPHLSVREEQGSKIIEDLCGKSAKVLCDPTMALTKDEWIKIEKKPAYLADKEYLLTYFLGDKNSEYDKYISGIAEREKLDVINLFDVTDLQAYATSPQEFIYLIHHANLVCTDSFHGAVFSIIMNTDFVTFSRKESGKSMESRMKTLLSTFKFENRDYRSVGIEHVFNVDFLEVEGILAYKRGEMLEFLNSAIYKSTEGKEGNRDTNWILDKNNCCGCTACAMICPRKCIKMQPDEEGFLYPQIDQELCVNCSLCQKVCPILKKNDKKDSPDCYIAYSKNDKIRAKSSSGGIFTELAKGEIKRGGLVYGAGFNENFEVVHQSARSEQEIEKLRGSKYVQSRMDDKYREIKEILDRGNLVYFSGTPCQVAGLYSYLENRPEKLITQDFICHGVPSPLVWEKYIETFGDVRKVEFRNKKYGWHYFALHIESDKKNYYKRLDEDFYLKLFLDNTILRPICYDCPIKKQGSSADITLADCWSLNQITDKVLDRDKGLSLVIANTSKGKSFLKKVKDSGDIVAIQVDAKKALNSQSALRESSICNSRRKLFFSRLQGIEFIELEKAWYNDSWIKQIRRKEIYLKTKLLYYTKNKEKSEK